MATAIINTAHERIAELDARNRELEVSFAEELRALAARVAAAQEDLTRVEARRLAAEQRAERAERRKARQALARSASRAPALIQSR